MATSIAQSFGQPQWARPLNAVIRRALIARLRDHWRATPTAPPLVLELPSGERIALGRPTPNATAVRIHDDQLFARMLLRGEIGAGEAYVASEWTTDDLAAVARAFLAVTGARGFESPLTWLAQWPSRIRHRLAANSRDGSRRNIAAHYDLGNQLYQLFLDPETLTYSCALWRDGDSLAAAQRAKYDRLCDWLALEPSDHLLEIGCGWGGMAIHAAATRKCRVTAITVSREQLALARQRVHQAGLADRVTIEYLDYRSLAGRFDKLVSIEMLEAVGYEYLGDYFAACARVMRPGGRFALQTITMPDHRFEQYRKRVDWMQTYVFPGSLIPSLGAIRDAIDGRFTITDSDNIGTHYAPTLREWRSRFAARVADGQVAALGFDGRFVRTWLLYLAFSEAAFSLGTLTDHQLLLTSRG